MGRKIKYMGTADNAVLEPGENFGGRLSTPLTQRAEWTLANGHLVDTDEARLTDAAITLLLADGRFIDVTDQELVPSSLGQQMWQGAPPAVPYAFDGPAGTPPTVVSADGDVKTDVVAGHLVPPDGTPAADSPLVTDQTLDESTKGKSKKP